MEGNVLDIMEEPHVEDIHNEGADLQVLVKIYEEENIGTTLIEIGRKDEVFLAMRNMDEDISSESTRKHDYLFRDLVTKNITEIEDKRCTTIACTSEGLSNTYDWEEMHSDNSLWMVESDPEEVADHIPYGSENKIPCSSIDWVDRDTL